MNIPLTFKLLSHNAIDWLLFLFSIHEPIELWLLSQSSPNLHRAVKHFRLPKTVPLQQFTAKVKKMDSETERVLQILQQKLMDMHQQHCLGAWLQGNLLVPSVLESVLSSIEFSYVHRTEYETDVDMAEVKNKLNPSKIRPNQKRNDWTKVAKGNRKREETSHGLETSKTRSGYGKQTT